MVNVKKGRAEKTTAVHRITGSVVGRLVKKPPEARFVRKFVPRAEARYCIRAGSQTGAVIKAAIKLEERKRAAVGARSSLLQRQSKKTDIARSRKSTTM